MTMRAGVNLWHYSVPIELNGQTVRGLWQLEAGTPVEAILARLGQANGLLWVVTWRWIKTAIESAVFACGYGFISAEGRRKRRVSDCTGSDVTQAKPTADSHIEMDPCVAPTVHLEKPSPRRRSRNRHHAVLKTFWATVLSQKLTIWIKHCWNKLHQPYPKLPSTTNNYQVFFCCTKTTMSVSLSRNPSFIPSLHIFPVPACL